MEDQGAAHSPIDTSRTGAHTSGDGYPLCNGAHTNEDGAAGQHRPVCSTQVSAVLQRAVRDGYLPPTGCQESLLQKPVALFYDLAAWETHLLDCAAVFGPSCLSAIAVKSNPLAFMLKRARELGFGAECASIGEVLHVRSLGFPTSKIVFDSPCKTHVELAWALEEGIHINVDNFSELDRVAELRPGKQVPVNAVVGLRINPLVGTGSISALSVSVADSKFGIPISAKKEIFDAFARHPWLNCVHVHTGSAGMAMEVLVAGVREAADLAIRVNESLGRRQVTVLDICGGLPVNYASDSHGCAGVPTFAEYAQALRQAVPGLLAEEGPACGLSIVTEFGASLNAKSGFLASRVEYVKPTATSTASEGDACQIAVVHFGADMCLRQCYTEDHPRRLEVYDGVDCFPKEGAPIMHQHVAGPLCFQGDMIGRSLELPRIDVDDFVVMRDTGANSLALFSRHCSRQTPVVLGYSRKGDLVELKPAEGFEALSAFWGGSSEICSSGDSRRKSRGGVEELCSESRRKSRGGAEELSHRKKFLNHVMAAPKRHPRGSEDAHETEGEDILNHSIQLYSTGSKSLKEILERMLCTGCDERSSVDPETKMNKYNTQPQPCHGVHRGSCTSNVPTKEAFNRGQDVMRRLILEGTTVFKEQNYNYFSSPDDLFTWLLHDIRERLRTMLHLTMWDCISLFPSGTDAELLPALLAVARCLTREHVQGSPPQVLSVITAAGEVGSGTRNAASGKHFSKLLPSGLHAKQVGGTGKDIFDVPSTMVTAKEVLLRDSTGRSRTLAELDQEVEQAVSSALEGDVEDKHAPTIGCVVVHMVFGSKTGRCVPSLGCFERLAGRFGDRVLLVVDACQGRMGEWAVREHLDMGHIVLTTGSKFFGGPPFAGVCLSPWSLTQELEQLISDNRVSDALRRGHLHEYVVASLLSSDMPQLRTLVPEKPLNYGLLMRWSLALHNMEVYFVDVPPEERAQIMASWSASVRTILRSAGAGLVTLLEEEGVAPNEKGVGAEASAALSTIVSFSCRGRRAGPGSGTVELSLDELKEVQRLMATDITELQRLMELPLPGLGQSAKLRCFMGQPVTIGPGVHVLRVAASAPLVVQIHDEGLEQILIDDRLFFEKLVLILGNWDVFGGQASN